MSLTDEQKIIEAAKSNIMARADLNLNRWKAALAAGDKEMAAIFCSYASGLMDAWAMLHMEQYPVDGASEDSAP